MIRERHTVYGTLEPKTIRITYPDRAETGGVGPCIALGILNKSSRVGYLAHYDPLHDFSDSILDQALAEAESPHDLDVVVAGNVPPLPEELSEGEIYEEELCIHRDYTETAVAQIRSKSISVVRYYLINEPGLASYEMIVDTETGIQVKKEDL